MSKVSCWSSSSLKLILAVGLLSLTGMSGQAQNQTVSGHLQVTGDTSLSGTLNVTGVVEFNSNITNFGSNGANAATPGLVLTYTDTASGTISTITLATSGTSAIWQWERNSANGLIPQMTLTGTNSIILWNPTISNSAGIILNPAGDSTFSGSITATGTNSRLPNQQISTDTASVLTVGQGDGRYLTPSVANATYLATTQGDSRYLLTSASDVPRLGNNQVYTGVNTFTSPIIQNGLQVYNGLHDSQLLHFGDASWGTSSQIDNQDWIQPERIRIHNPDSTTQPSISFYASNGVYMGQFGGYNADSYIGMVVVPNQYAPGLNIAFDRNFWITGGPVPGNGVGPYYSSYDHLEGIKFYQWVEFQTHVAAIDVDMAGKLTVAGATTLSGPLTLTGADSRMPNQQITDTASILTKGLADELYMPASTTSSPYLTTTVAANTYVTSAQVASSYIPAGYQTTTTGSYSTALGYNTIAAGSGQLVIGQYNSPLVSDGDNSASWVSTDALFVIGNGTSDLRSNALVVSKNGDALIAGSATVGKRLKVTGKAAFADEVTIPQKGDLSMGSFTNSGLTRAQTVAETYFSTLASSSVAKNLSDTEKENIISFLTGLDQIVGLDNVVECWTFRSTQNAGAGGIVYGLKGAYNGNISGTLAWNAMGIVWPEGDQNYIQFNYSIPQSPANPDFTMAVVIKSGASPMITRYYMRFLSNYVGISSDYSSFYSDLPEDGPNGRSRLSTGSTDLYETTNTRMLAVTKTGTFVTSYKSGSLVGSGIANNDIANASNLCMGFHMPKDTGAFSIITRSALTDAQHANLYTLYKSTIGQGLGLP